LLHIRQIFREKVNEAPDTGKDDNDKKPLALPAGSHGMNGKIHLHQYFA
jgi:hypothetical protein